MINPNLYLLLAFGIGVVAGLRALTAPATISWAARMDWVDLHGTHFAFMSSMAAIIIFTVAAILEIVNDKLPKTGARTAVPSVIIRMVMGGFSGAMLCRGEGVAIWAGVILGMIGALVGTYGGYQVRTRLVKALHSPDFVIALLEDAVAICGGLYLASRL